MADWWALSFLAIGFAFNLTGLILGGKAFVVTWAEFGDGPLWPWLARLGQHLAAGFNRLNPWRRRDATGLAVSGAAHANATASVHVVGRVGFATDAPDTELIRQLVSAVEGIYKELSDERELTRQAIASVQGQLGEVQAQLTSETSRLEQLSKKVAVGDVRIQLTALVAIGIGTVLSAVPAIWDALAAIY